MRLKAIAAQSLPMTGSTVVNDSQDRSAVQSIPKGTHISIGELNKVNAQLGSACTDEEGTAVANFVVGHLGDKQGPSRRSRWRNSVNSNKRRES